MRNCDAAPETDDSALVLWPGLSRLTNGVKVSQGWKVVADEPCRCLLFRHRQPRERLAMSRSSLPVFVLTACALLPLTPAMHSPAHAEEPKQGGWDRLRRRSDEGTARGAKRPPHSGGKDNLLPLDKASTAGKLKDSFLNRASRGGASPVTCERLRWQIAFSTSRPDRPCCPCPFWNKLNVNS